MNFHYGAADEGGSSAAAAQKRRAEGAPILSHGLLVHERLWDDGCSCVLTVVDPFTSMWAKR